MREPTKTTEMVNLEENLKKIETEVRKYREEVDKKEKEKKEKQERIRNKEKKEIHWAMLRWVTAFIQENQESWERRRREEIREREEEREKEEWESMTRDQRLQKLREEEINVRKESKTGREERLETALKLKSIWKRRRREEDEQDTDAEAGLEVGGVEELEEEEEVRLAMEMEEAERIENGDLIGDIDKFCTDCAMMPCSCLLMYLDLKLRELNHDSRVSREEEERRSNSRASTEAGVDDAGH